MASGVLVAGKYRIERPLGAGGMSAVYGAIHIGLEQRVAIKVLHPQFAADLKVVQRFIREAKASARISGEHVGRVIDVGATEEGSPYIALELLEGEDLGDHVDRRPDTRGAAPTRRGVRPRLVSSGRTSHFIAHASVRA